MSWRFWKWSADREDLRKQLTESNQQAAETSKQVSEVSEQLNKLMRLQYKSSQDILGKLERINTNADDVRKAQASMEEANGRLKAVEERMRNMSDSLIRWLDDMDYALINQPEGWHQVIAEWSRQLLLSLALLGIREVEVLGRSFDSRLAESVKAIGLDEYLQLYPERERSSDLYAPYEVLQVLKRGLVSETGQLIRKAQVITLQGGGNSYVESE